MKKLEWLASFFSWLQIVISPTFFGAIIACIFYYNAPSTTRLIISVTITVIAFVIGIVLATKIWKKQGTTEFISKIDASPELDNVEDYK